MANITYSATGRKNSKKNPAIINLNIHLDCDETVSMKLVYSKEHGWHPALDSSSRAVYLYCVYVTHDHMWTNEALQNYINGYFNLANPTRDANIARLNWMGHYSKWRYNENNDSEIIIWGTAK